MDADLTKINEDIIYGYKPEDRKEIQGASFWYKIENGDSKKDSLSSLVFEDGVSGGNSRISISFRKNSDSERIQKLLLDFDPAFEVDHSREMFVLISKGAQRSQLAEVAFLLATNRQVGSEEFYPVLQKNHARDIWVSEIERSGLPLAKLGVEMTSLETSSGELIYDLKFADSIRGVVNNVPASISEDLMPALAGGTSHYRLTRVDLTGVDNKCKKRFIDLAKNNGFVFEGSSDVGDDSISIYATMGQVARLLKDAGLFMPEKLLSEIDQKMQDRGEDPSITTLTKELQQKSLGFLRGKALTIHPESNVL